MGEQSGRLGAARKEVTRLERELTTKQQQADTLQVGSSRGRVTHSPDSWLNCYFISLVLRIRNTRDL